MSAWFDNFFFTYQNLIYSVGVDGLLALSMYVVLSVGQLSLGQAAFMGLGAYSSAIIAKAGAPIPVGLAGSIVLPSLVAAIIGVPTLRLSGIYLALATIGLGEVLRIAFINLHFTGGALGLSNIPMLGDYVALFSIYGALAAIAFLLVLVARSALGRAMEAMREDELAASALGINLPRAKLAALIASAAIAGLAGAFNAHVTSFIGPDDYGFDMAVSILSYALLGGIGSPLGPILGATILTLLPEILRPLHDWRLAVNGAVIVVAVLFMPRGLLPWRMSRIAAREPSK